MSERSDRLGLWRIGIILSAVIFGMLLLLRFKGGGNGAASAVPTPGRNAKTIRLGPWRTSLIFGAGILVMLLLLRFEGGSIGAAYVAPTPGPDAMTIYSVTNPNAFAITVNHVITNTAGFYYAFTSSIPANSTVDYHLRDMAAVPDPFNGSATLSSDQPFTSQITGYDYPTTATATATSTPLGSTATATPPLLSTATPTGGGNVASGRTAWASSTASGSAASAAVDGTTTTYWQSASGGEQWLAVDLGAVYTISQVNVKWAAAYATYYYVEYSSDGTNWQTIWTVTSGTGNESVPTGGSARYVRIRATIGIKSTNYQLAELEVVSPQPAPTNTPTPTPTSDPLNSVVINLWEDSHQSPVLTTFTDPALLNPSDNLWDEFLWLNRGYPGIFASTDETPPTMRFYASVPNGTYTLIANLYHSANYRYYYGFAASQPRAFSFDVTSGPAGDFQEYVLGSVTVSNGIFELYTNGADLLSGTPYYYGWAWLKLAPATPSPTPTTAPATPTATGTATPSRTQTMTPTTVPGTPTPTAPAATGTPVTAPTGTATPPLAPTATPSTSTNLARGRSTWASSTASGSTPSEAVDGATTTYWQSANGGDQWLAVDLGAVHNISQVNIRWSSDYAKGYSVEYSNDGVNWQSVASVKNGKGNDSLTIGGSTRYVRIHSTRGVTSSDYQLDELQVVGN